MKKKAAIELAGSVAELATLLGITHQAIYAWKGDDVPTLQAYRLKEKKPAWFRVKREAKARG